MIKKNIAKKWLKEFSEQYSNLFPEFYRFYFDRIKDYDVVPVKSAVIFVLGISFKDKNNSRKKDESGVLDNDYRLEASVKLVKKCSKDRNKTNLILVAGYEKNLNWRTKLMKNWIEKRIQNESYKAKLEELHCHKGNTCGNVKKIIEYVAETKRNLNNKSIGILTNFYHMPRFEALFAQMMKGVPKPWEKRLNKIKIEPIIAELVIGKDKLLDIKSFYKREREEMKKRFSNEARGYLQAQTGCYKCYW